MYRTCLLVCLVVSLSQQAENDQKTSASEAIFNWEPAYQFTPQNMQYARATVDYDLSSLQNAGHLNSMVIPATDPATQHLPTELPDYGMHVTHQPPPPMTTMSNVVLRPRVQQQDRSPVVHHKLRLESGASRGHKIASASNAAGNNYDVSPLPPGYHNMDSLNAMDLEIEPHVMGLPPTVKIETRDGQPYVEIYPTQPGSQPRLEITPFKRNSVTLPSAQPTSSSQRSMPSRRRVEAITSIPRRYERIIENSTMREYFVNAVE